jgi:acyl dehydratase
LALSLLPWLSQQTLSIRDTKMAVNLGLNRVRFPAPIIAGSRLRGRFTLRQIDTLEPLGGMPACKSSGKSRSSKRTRPNQFVSPRVSRGAMADAATFIEESSATIYA